MATRIFLQTSTEAQIKNLTFTNVNITKIGDTPATTGTICGYNKGVIENCGIKSGKLESKSSLNTTNNYVGGICGDNVGGYIENCYNGGNINSMHENTAGWVVAGGISGFSRDTSVRNCYNVGNITYKNGTGFIQIAGIVGRNGDGVGNKSNIENSYFLNTKTNLLANAWNGTAYVADTRNGKSENDMRNASFIGQLGEAFMQDIEKEDGTWQYNNGYPILKWQLNTN